MDPTMRQGWRLGVGAAVTLVFVAGTITVAGAKDDKPDTDEVTNTTVISSEDGVVTGPGLEDEHPVFEPIPLSQGSFTQRAGEVLVISTRAEFTRVTEPDQSDGGEHCDVAVSLTGFSDEQGWDFLVEDMHLLARRGDPGLWIDDAVIPAPPTDKVYTLEAAVWSEKVAADTFGGTPVASDCSDETVAASLRISLTTLRD